MVRSLTLDVKVWEPSVISLFQSLGNAYANSVWEELLRSKGAFHVDLPPSSSLKADKSHQIFISKPSAADSIAIKEKFIHAKVHSFNVSFSVSITQTLKACSSLLYGTP
ncbi:hypothetical protein KSS87_000284 [Heliosperma pusillum]|nr:hypothetical protein KSS87_000284 [Heliosperma pusillum]